MSIPQLGKSANIEGIQYLRGVAALMVVFHHARAYFPHIEEWTEFGAAGVDVFFVISGFIMAHATRNYDGDRARLPQASDFLLKRAIRIVPLYWLATLITLLWHREYKASMLADFFFVPRYSPYRLEMIAPLLNPGWTINYEIFFYLVFAFAMLFGRTRFVILGAVLTTLVAIGIATPFAAAVPRFYTSSIVLEFLLGVGVYFVLLHTRNRLGRPALLGLAAAAFACVGLVHGHGATFLPGVFAAVLVWSMVLWSQNISVTALRKLGDASYSIYLFHGFSFGATKRLCHWLGIIEPTPLNIALAIGIQVIGAIAAGLLVYELFEKPSLRYLRSKMAGPARLQVAATP